mmetsp:Transcript_35312/g.59947  ORF Transcript_35312/g.59947 Transcript_35312/m.59947 type:complete len:112 (-) Transcript_35312:413-748(-)|eukprot:CAMPEP_0183788490 /NCGR_PEP_ID=MMETSP0739-20130205/68091_1 /TAXON_ID=385413 /ORGANISM="Thalassiosira miniscula, Strain CCMP1093" /LENGTH=111 /DNA_ID=CAMNT_0026032615 /DNA_START=113 /DNA_END=448 /DNA_ORIENTATION=+
MKDYILSADQRIRTEKARAPTTGPIIDPDDEPSYKDRLFFHLEYHRNDIPSQAIRTLYNIHCKPKFEEIGIKQFTIAYSRSKNVRDATTKAKLHLAAGKEASKYYLGELPA